MRNIPTLIWHDFRGLRRVCGLRTAAKWLLAIARTLPECRRAGYLRPADWAMGHGPFRVRRGRATATVTGRVFGGIREIWVRDVYLRNDFLRIEPGMLVVDLGANRGNFTILALAHGPDVRVVAVEPGEALNEAFRESVAANGWLDRVTLLRCFVGGRTGRQSAFLADAEYRGAPFMSTAEFMGHLETDRIDYLKCDIEGSEFDLLRPDSPILVAAQQVAVEVHDHAGDRDAFMRMLESAGFVIGPVKHDPDGCIVLAKRAAS